jgi:hypothetical protein
VTHKFVSIRVKKVHLALLPFQGGNLEGDGFPQNQPIPTLALPVKGRGCSIISVSRY